MAKLDEAIKQLATERASMEKEIQVADCLASALLTERPMDIDSLLFCARALKKARDSPIADLTRYRKNYEPQIRELLKGAFLSVFSHEFVKKSVYLQLERYATDLSGKIKTFSEKMKKLETEDIVKTTEIDRLTDEVKKFKEQEDHLIKKMDRIVEIYHTRMDRSLKFG